MLARREMDWLVKLRRGDTGARHGRARTLSGLEPKCCKTMFERRVEQDQVPGESSRGCPVFARMENKSTENLCHSHRLSLTAASRAARAIAPGPHSVARKGSMPGREVRLSAGGAFKTGAPRPPPSWGRRARHSGPSLKSVAQSSSGSVIWVKKCGH